MKRFVLPTIAFAIGYAIIVYNGENPLLALFLMTGFGLLYFYVQDTGWARTTTISLCSIGIGVATIGTIRLWM